MTEDDMRQRIENVLGLEPAFAVIDEGGSEPWAEKDPEKRWVVYDAEMQVVCRCAERDYAELIRDLLEAATP
jgi:hypothetical protein